MKWLANLKRTDRLRYRLLQWPVALAFYLVMAPFAAGACIIMGLGWPILGKEEQ